MPWKVTVRTGPRVRRESYADRELALDAVEERVRELARSAPAKTVDLKYTKYTPEEQVASRIELAGPERLLPSVRAGIDVRGDGSTQAFVGRVRRQLVEPGRGETPAQALRRALQN